MNIKGYFASLYINSSQLPPSSSIFTNLSQFCNQLWSISTTKILSMYISILHVSERWCSSWGKILWRSWIRGGTTELERPVTGPFAAFFLCTTAFTLVCNNHSSTQFSTYQANFTAHTELYMIVCLAVKTWGKKASKCHPTEKTYVWVMVSLVLSLT